MSPDGAVGIVARLQGGILRNRGSIPGIGKRFMSAPKRLGPLWGPISLLFNGYRWGLSQGWSGQGMNEADHSAASVPRLTMGRTKHALPNSPSWRAREQLYLYVYIQTYCARRIQITGFSARWVMTLPGLACAGQHFEGTVSQFSGHTLGNINHDLLSHLDLAMCSRKTIMSVSVYEGALSSRSGVPNPRPYRLLCERGRH